MSSLDEKIKKQVEFYFSDSAYRKDTFLRAAAEADPEGFVPIAVLTTFNKLKSLSEDVATIANALTESTVVTLSDDNTKVKKTTPLPEEDSSRSRTLYVKGYPLSDPDVTIDSINEQFSEYGKILYVRLRRDPETKAFKGSCFIEFADESTVNEVVAAAYEESTVKMMYKETPFDCVMSLNAWLERKAAKRAKRKGASDEAVAVAGENLGDKRKRSEGDDATKEEDVMATFTPGLIIHTSNIPSDATLFQIKDFFKAIADIKYVDYKVGETTAIVRTVDTAGSSKILAAIEKGLTFNEDASNANIKLEGKLVSGEEETSYWKMIAADSKKNAARGGNKFGKGGRGGGGRGRGGRGGGGRGGGGRGGAKRQRS